MHHLDFQLVVHSGPVVEGLTRDRGVAVRVSQEAPRCVLEQDSQLILSFVLVQSRKARPDTTEKLLTGT